MQRFHKASYNKDINVARVKPRWDAEESHLLTTKEIELESKATNINQLFHSFSSRSLESIKFHLKQKAYKDVVARITAERATTGPSSGQVSNDQDRQIPEPTTRGRCFHVPGPGDEALTGPTLSPADKDFPVEHSAASSSSQDGMEFPTVPGEEGGCVATRWCRGLCGAAASVTALPLGILRFDLGAQRE